MTADATTRPDERLAPVEPGDHDRFAHYAPKADIARAMVEGVPIVALCGKRWTPSRDASQFPTCPECREAYEALEDG